MTDSASQGRQCSRDANQVLIAGMGNSGTSRLSWLPRTAIRQVFKRPGGDLGPRREPELAEGVVDVSFGGVLGNYELLSDLTITQSTRNQAGHLLFARGKPTDYALSPRRSLARRNQEVLEPQSQAPPR
jgi:hypothetical protein